MHLLRPFARTLLFTLTVPADAVLIFSSVGYSDVEIEVGGQSTINVSMSEDVTKLDEVVVTALGISREKRSMIMDF